MTTPPPSTENTPAPQYYSQHGEDIILTKAFGQSTGPNYFVEVGLIDGKRFSNTLALEQAGWTGLCVEAHPAYVPLVRQNRPGSTVVHAAAGDQVGEVSFFADPRGDLSSLCPPDESEMKRRWGQWFQGFEPVKVPMIPLDQMLQEAGAPVEMEVVSIDVEGAELTVLRGFNLAKWRPRVLVLESNEPGREEELCEYLSHFNYRLARHIGVNGMYVRRLDDYWRINLARLDQTLLHTPSPADAEGVAKTSIAFETTGMMIQRIVRQLAA